MIKKNHWRAGQFHLFGFCKKTLFSGECLSEIVEVEVGALLKIKESALANDCFQQKPNAEIGIFWQTLFTNFGITSCFPNFKILNYENL